MLNKYLDSKDLKISDSQDSNNSTASLNVTTNKLNCALEDTVTETKPVNLEIIKENIKKTLIFYGNALGEINYRLAKVLHEQTKDLGFTDTHRVFAFVSDFLGISIQTIRHLVKCYRKLEKLNIWHSETGLFKLRLFQLIYYIDKNITEVDTVIDDLYRTVVNDFKLRVWFESSSYKEILTWFKERYKTYLRVFKRSNIITHNCDICNRELTQEEFNKSWTYLPICFTCLDILKEENREKLVILKNAITKKLKESKIASYEIQIQELKSKLIETINELDEIRLAKSRKYRKIVEKINS